MVIVQKQQETANVRLCETEEVLKDSQTTIEERIIRVNLVLQWLLSLLPFRLHEIQLLCGAPQLEGAVLAKSELNGIVL